MIRLVQRSVGTGGVNSKKENKMHWLSWERLTLPKRNGGLGFRDIHAFNMAMLAKKGWRLLQLPDSLCARVLRAKYFPDGDVLEAKPVQVCHTLGVAFSRSRGLVCSHGCHRTGGLDVRFLPEEQF